MITLKGVVPELEEGHREAGPAVALRGLCTTCEHAPYCTYPRDPARPVQQCEEFDDGTEVRFEAAGRIEVQRVRRAVEPEGQGSPFWGLCTNCDLRETCTYPRSQGGVWHCEEYR